MSKCLLPMSLTDNLNKCFSMRILARRAKLFGVAMALWIFLSRSKNIYRDDADESWKKHTLRPSYPSKLTDIFEISIVLSFSFSGTTPPGLFVSVASVSSSCDKLRSNSGFEVSHSSTSRSSSFTNSRLRKRSVFGSTTRVDNSDLIRLLVREEEDTIGGSFVCSFKSFCCSCWGDCNFRGIDLVLIFSNGIPGFWITRVDLLSTDNGSLTCGIDSLKYIPLLKLFPLI